jgi:hypothetical protein
LVPTPLSQAIPRGNWKLLDVAGERSLFDLSSGPAEEQNLSDRRPGLVAALARPLAAWTKRVHLESGI